MNVVEEGQAKRQTSPRPGDWVEVVDPRYVLRVGYPRTPADYFEEVRAKHEKTLREVYGFKARLDVHGQDGKMPWQLRRALQDLAYLACKRDGFGGPERTVHLSESVESFRGRFTQVVAVRTVQTGTYYAPSCERSYYGEYDYEPGGLTNMKTRRLIRLNLWAQALSHAVALSRQRLGGTEFLVESLRVPEKR